MAQHYFFWHNAIMNRFGAINLNGVFKPLGDAALRENEGVDKSGHPSKHQRAALPAAAAPGWCRLFARRA
jgi:hypothetical protein